MHADLFNPFIDFVPSRPDGARDFLISEVGEQLLLHAETNIDPRVPFDTRVVIGSAVPAICDVALETASQLIVMGTHGRSGVRRLLFGSVTEAIMRTADVAVIAVNAAPDERASIRTILCPVAYTEQCLAALRHAAALVNSRNSPIVLLHAIDDVADPRDIPNELLRLHDWLPRELVDRCELRIVPAHATAEWILAAASISCPDLIVLGVAPDRTMTDVLRGTIAERLLQHSNCPILTVAAQASIPVGRTKTAQAEALY